MNRNSKIGIFLGILVLGICGVCGWAGINYAVKTVREDGYDEPFYTLIADGDRLYVSYSESNQTFDAVKGEPAKVRVSIDLVGTEWKMTIKDGAKMVERRAKSMLNEVWSEKDQALYFLSNDYGDDEKNIPPSGEIWRWNRKDGFVMLHKEDHLNFMSMSMDGNLLGGVVSTGYGDEGENYFTYSVRDKKTNLTKYEPGSGVPVLIDQNTVIVSGNPPKIVDLKFGAIMGANLDGYCLDFKWFRGQPWGMRYLNGKYDVVRYAKDFSKVEEAIPIPETFPKVSPPSEGS